MGEVGMVSIRWWELGAQILNTIILFLALRHFLFKPVTKFMQDRRDEIAGNIQDAENEKAQAQELKLKYQAKLDNIEDEAKEIYRDATRKGDARREEIIQEAEKEAQKILNRAKLETEREKAKAMDDLRDDMVEMSLAAASMIIQQKLDDGNHEKLIQQYIDEMGDVHV